MCQVKTIGVYQDSVALEYMKLNMKVKNTGPTLAVAKIARNAQSMRGWQSLADAEKLERELYDLVSKLLYMKNIDNKIEVLKEMEWVSYRLHNRYVGAN